MHKKTNKKMTVGKDKRDDNSDRENRSVCRNLEDER